MGNCGQVTFPQCALGLKTPEEEPILKWTTIWSNSRYIIEQFEKYYLTANNPLTQFSHHLETFKKHWQERTVRFKCLKIQERQVLDLYLRLPPPLGE